jgi:hypothetical protein
MYCIKADELKFIKWIPLYFAVFGFSRTLNNKKWLKPIILIIQLPISIFPLIFSINVFLLVFGFSYGIFALILFFLPEYLLNLDLNFATKLYLVLTFGSIILTKWGVSLIKYFNSIVNSSRTKAREEAQLNLTLELANEKAIKSFTYLLYFIYLIPYSVTTLAGTSLFAIPNIEKSIFFAFITYTALERVLTSRSIPSNCRALIEKFVKTLN